MATPKTAEISDYDWQRAVESINAMYQRVIAVDDKVRQLEFRVDQFTPKTVNMTVTNHTPLLLAGVAVFAFWAGAVGYRGYLEKKKSEQPLQESTT